MHKPSLQDERDESGFVEVLVDVPDSLKVAAQLEAKRMGQSLEQWIADAVTKALAENKNGEQTHG